MARRDVRTSPTVGLALLATLALTGSVAAAVLPEVQPEKGLCGNLTIAPEQPDGPILNFENLEFNRVPSNPVAGSKMTIQMHIINLGNVPSVKGEIAVWANSNKETPCSTSGPTDADVTVKFPALKPFDSKLVTATVTVPSTPGDYTLQILYDSTCANNINSDLAHTSVDYQVLGSPEPDYGLLNIYGSGVDKSEAFCSPARPVVNQTFEVTLTIKNFGSGVYDSSTPVLKVYPGIWFGESDPTGSPPEQQPVTDVQPATIQLPKIKPGKTFVAKATLTVPEAGLWKLDAILEINEVQFKNFDLFYGVTPEPLPYFMPVYQPGTVGYKVSTSPAKIKTGPDAKPYKVKVTFENVGTAPGKIGTLAYYKGNVLDALFPVIKDKCVTTNADAVADFGDVELAPGNKKTFTIEGAPPFNTTGWFLASVVADALCAAGPKSGYPADQAFATKGAP